MQSYKTKKTTRNITEIKYKDNFVLYFMDLQSYLTVWLNLYTKSS